MEFFFHFRFEKHAQSRFLIVQNDNTFDNNFFFENHFVAEWSHTFIFFVDLTVCYKCESERIITFEEETQWRYFCCAWIVWLVYMVLRLWFSWKLWVTSALDHSVLHLKVILIWIQCHSDTFFSDMFYYYIRFENVF